MYQTFIGNSDLVQAPSKRFTKWPGNISHPKWLGAEDLTDMINSGAWFARKLLPDDRVLTALDRYLGFSHCNTRQPAFDCIRQAS